MTEKEELQQKLEHKDEENRKLKVYIITFCYLFVL